MDLSKLICSSFVYSGYSQVNITSCLILILYFIFSWSDSAVNFILLNFEMSHLIFFFSSASLILVNYVSPHFILPSLVWSTPFILPHLILSSLVSFLSDSITFCISSYLLLFQLISSLLNWTCLIVSYFILSYCFLSHLILPCHISFVLFYLIPFSSLSHLILPHVILSFLIYPYPDMWFGIPLSHLTL